MEIRVLATRASRPFPGRRTRVLPFLRISLAVRRATWTPFVEFLVFIVEEVARKIRHSVIVDVI